MNETISPYNSKAFVKVRRNDDDVEMVIPYKAYNDIRDSVDDIINQKKVTLIGQCTAEGAPIAGNPDLSEEDQAALQRK